MFRIICVVYNKFIDQISSLNVFYELKKKHDDVIVQIYDNSKEEIAKKNQETTALGYLDIIYIWNNGNIGLSKSYNKALSESKLEDWLFFADDDTSFPVSYLEKVYSYTHQDNVSSVVSGIIYSQSGAIISPLRKIDHNGLKLNGDTICKEVYCINSGLCVKREIYEIIGFYNETLFLDMIDYWLFDELSKYKMNKVMILDERIMQDFSGGGRSALKTMLVRFRIYKKDFSNYCTIEKKGFIYKYKILGRRIVKILYFSLFNRRKDA